jgi:hypothetical protein
MSTGTLAFLHLDGSFQPTLVFALPTRKRKKERSEERGPNHTTAFVPRGTWVQSSKLIGQFQSEADYWATTTTAKTKTATLFC